MSTWAANEERMHQHLWMYLFIFILNLYEKFDITPQTQAFGRVGMSFKATGWLALLGTVKDLLMVKAV